MKSRLPVGIQGYGAYLPLYRLPTSEVARVWKGGGAGPNVEKAVAGIDEDSVTMAVEAARRAVKMAGIGELGAIFVGSESHPYAVKPTSTIVAQALGQHRTLASDFEFACKAGTETVQVITGLVGSGMISNGLAVGVDTAQGRPGDELEYTAGSGAAALVLSNTDGGSIARIEGSTSYVSDTTDFWRREAEPYPRHLSRFTGEPAYFHHVETAVRALFDELGLGPRDFSHAIFHQPNPKFPIEVGQRLGFTMKQIERGLLNPRIGNSYAACSLVGLAAVLDEARPGERVLLASFGSGAGSDAFSLLVLDAIEEKREKENSIKAQLKSVVRIDYSLYTKFRQKIVR